MNSLPIQSIIFAPELPPFLRLELAMVLLFAFGIVTLRRVYRSPQVKIAEAWIYSIYRIAGAKRTER